MVPGGTISLVLTSPEIGTFTLVALISGSASNGTTVTYMVALAHAFGVALSQTSYT